MFRPNFNLIRSISKQLILRCQVHSKTKAVPIHRQMVFKDETIPRITMPHVMVRTLDKLKYKKNVKEAQKKFVGKQSNLMITCRDKKFNHYKGQTYRDFGEKDFASWNWKGRKSKDDYFTIVPSMEHPALQDEFESFSELGMSEKVVAALKEIRFEKPTNIQSQVIPPMLKGASVHCAAETGNGKTLAFLLPAIEKILKVKAVDLNPLPNRPIGVIIVPSRELADQIYCVAKSICKQLDIKVDNKCGGRGTKRIVKTFHVKPIDLLIATPGVLSKLLSNKYYNMEALSFVALDEVDTLFDDSFTDVMIKVMRNLKVLEEKPISLIEDDDEGLEKSFDEDGLPSNESPEIKSDFQLILTGATMPKGVQKLLGEMLDMDSLQLVTTPHLNCILPHVKQKFIRLQPSQKLDYLVEQLKNNLKNSTPTIVFCNSSGTVNYLDNVLKEQGIDVINFHAKIPQQVRSGIFWGYQEGKSNILITTDIGSRGLDTVRTKHVINYDFPNFISDYIHRSGRVGRVGSPAGCLVTNYIVRKWDVDLVWKIEKSLRRNEVLNDINANIKRKLEDRHAQKVMLEQQQLLQTEQDSYED